MSASTLLPDKQVHFFEMPPRRHYFGVGLVVAGLLLLISYRPVRELLRECDLGMNHRGDSRRRRRHSQGSRERDSSLEGGVEDDPIESERSRERREHRAARDHSRAREIVREDGERGRTRTRSRWDA